MRASRRTTAAVAAALLAAAALAPLAVRREAAACGMVFRAPNAERLPALEHEQVLIVYDPKSWTEHFVRQVAFTKTTEPFGFVVPTPTRPEVKKVETSPFGALRANLPFSPTPRGGLGGIGGGGAPGGGSGGSGGVTILDVSKVGSFTAFILAANDAKGLAAWLKEQNLVTSPDADAWLAHYVKMSFFYVAMRYDPPAEPKPAKPPEKTDAPPPPVLAETIRITFKTPRAYYPYFEHARSALDAPAHRLLDLWLVSTGQLTPLALLDKTPPAWVRPMRPGQSWADGRPNLQAALEDELESLLPEGPLTVQTFQDQKTSRELFDDILFVPSEKKPLTDDEKAALKPLLGILDRKLVGAAP